MSAATTLVLICQRIYISTYTNKIPRGKGRPGCPATVIISSPCDRTDFSKEEFVGDQPGSSSTRKTVSTTKFRSDAATDLQNKTAETIKQFRKDLAVQLTFSTDEEDGAPIGNTVMIVN